MIENTLTFQKAQEDVDNYIKTIGVRYFSELTNLAILMEEVGEFSRLMARKYGDQSFKKGENPDGIKSEIGDILFVITCLANQMNLSLEECFQMTLHKNSTRDVTRHKENEKLQK